MFGVKRDRLTHLMMNRDEIFLVDVGAHFDAVVVAVAEVPGLKGRGRSQWKL
jgi:hypothetical protein